MYKAKSNCIKDVSPIEPIISKEDFKAVQKIIKERKCPNKDLIKKYPLSKNIYCDNCGSAFRRKVSNKKVYWVCRGHYYNLEQCGIKQISEQKFYNAFIVMYNKLKTNYSAIFPPMLSQLQELENAKFSNNKQYIEINKEIAQLKEQIHVLARLKTKGFLGESKYLEQTSELNSKIEKLYAEQRKISKCDDEDEIMDQIKEIASIIDNGSELIAEFDEVMFESLIEKTIVKNHTELEFNLYGGLKFTEKI